MRFSPSQLLFVIHLTKIASLLWKIRFDLIMISTAQRSFRWSFLNNPSTLHKCVHCAVFNISWFSCIVLLSICHRHFFPIFCSSLPKGESCRNCRRNLSIPSGLPQSSSLSHLENVCLDSLVTWQLKTWVELSSEKWRRLVPLQLTDKQQGVWSSLRSEGEAVIKPACHLFKAFLIKVNYCRTEPVATLSLTGPVSIRGVGPCRCLRFDATSHRALK